MPPPVPSDSTRGAAPPDVRAKVSATRVANGKTVDDPAAQMPDRVPDGEPPAPPPSPQAARAMRAVAATAYFSERIISRSP